mgnify:CR=1 FL=1
MTAGSVLSIKDFQFSDGGISPLKLVIILNNPSAGEDYLLVKTTSKVHDKSNTQGCYSSENYYFITKGQDKFHDNTWVIFDEYYQMTQAQMLSGITKTVIRDMFDLEKTLWTAVKNCILKSVDLPGDYEEMIKRC